MPAFSLLSILVRQARSKPLLFAAVVATVAIGICSTVAVFSVFWSMLLRDLPYPQAERTVVLGSASGENQAPGRISLADAASIRAGTNALSRLATFWPIQETAAFGASVRSVRATFASTDFFSVFAVEPKLGNIRALRTGAGWGAVLSHRLWVSEFGANPRVLGAPIRAEGKLYEVIAVMPPEFGYPDRTDVWLPLESWDQDSRFQDRGGRYLLAAGLLAPGVTLPRLQSALDVVSQRIAQEFPRTNQGIRSRAVTLRQSEIGEVRPYLILMLAVTGCLLLICCGNVAGLLFAWAAARRQEIAVRLALGASQPALLKQLLAESLVLAATGGGFGALGAFLILPLVRNRLSGHVPEWVRIEANWPVLGFAVVLALLAGVVSGVCPAFRSLRLPFNHDLRSGGLGTRHRDQAVAQRCIVAAEIALSFTLLVAALLLSRSFLNLSAVDSGLQSGNLVVAHVVPYSPAGTDPLIAERLSRLLAELKTIPGVVAAGGANILPFTRDANMRRDASVLRGALSGSVAPGYFASMGIPLVRGRDFTDRDGPAGPRIAIVSQSLANALWPGDSPLGREVQIDDWAGAIVGVAGNVKYSPFESGPAMEIYFPIRQQPPGQFHLTLRVRQDPQASLNTIGDAIRRIDRAFVVTSVQSMDDIKRNFLWRQSLWSFLAAAVAAAASAMIGAGLFGLMTFVTRGRLHEIGIRVALGAAPGNTAVAVFWGGLRLVGAGLVLGIPASLVTARFLRGLLFGIAPTDLSTFLYCSGFLALIAVLACVAPASLAVRVDPAAALRSE